MARNKNQEAWNSKLLDIIEENKEDSSDFKRVKKDNTRIARTERTGETGRNRSILEGRGKIAIKSIKISNKE